MTYQLKITAAAKEDIEENYSWYERKLFGLGNEFIAAVEGQINLILQHPESFVLFANDYRKCNTKKFPFKIIYSVDEGTVIIWAIYHHSRNIKKWKR